MSGIKLFNRLLLLRIQSVFKGSGKKNEHKNIGFMVFIIAMIAYAALCFIGIFGVYFGRLASNFVEQECGFAYFSMVSVIMLSIGFVTTVFAAQSQIFEAKDNDLLTSMPIPPRYILMTRIATLLLLEFVESLVIGIEAVIVYRFFAPIPAGGYALLIFQILGLNMITASVSSLIGLVLAAITSKVHRKSLITTVMTIIIAFGFFMLINKGENYLNSMLDNDVDIETAMKSDLFIFYYFGVGVERADIVRSLQFMASAVALFSLTILIISPFFLKITSTKTGNIRKKYNSGDNVERSIKATLFRKEQKRFFGNASYMLNTGMGLLVLIGGSIMILIEKEKIFNVITDFSYMRQHIGVYVIFIELFFCAINVISSPSISLEGESLWISKSMPVRPIDILISKVKSHIVICMPFVIIFGIAANIALPISLPMRIAIMTIPALSTVFTAFLGVVDNLILPKFDWTDESVAVKQSLAVVATMGIGFGILVVNFIAYAFVHWHPLADTVFCLFMQLEYLFGILFLFRYLKKNGSKRFLEL